ncbi:MAG: DUF6079 family protein [Spirochaetota bacterium]
MKCVSSQRPSKYQLQDIDPPALIEALGVLNKFEELFASKEYLENKIRYLRGITGTEFIQKRDEILGRFTVPELLDGYENLRKNIETLISKYVEFYFDKHEKAVGALANFSPITNLREQGNFEKLKTLSEIRGLKVAQGFEEIEWTIKATIEKACSILRKEDLFREPRCVLGANEAIKVKELKRRFEKLLSELFETEDTVIVIEK